MTAVIAPLASAFGLDCVGGVCAPPPLFREWVAGKGRPMTQYAVLRHQFDVHRRPDRLGPISDHRFCLSMNPGGESPSWLVGNIVWLVSWEGFMKTHHVVAGWFQVGSADRWHGVVAHHCAYGDEGELFPRGLGPLDMQAWFHKFVEAHRRFREGEPTDLGDYAGELTAFARSAGFRVPEVSDADQPAPRNKASV